MSDHVNVKEIIDKVGEFLDKEDIAKAILDEAVRKATSEAKDFVDGKVKELNSTVDGLKNIHAQFGSSFGDIFQRAKLVSTMTLKGVEVGEIHIGLRIDPYQASRYGEHVHLGWFDSKVGKEYVVLVTVIEKE